MKKTLLIAVCALCITAGISSPAAAGQGRHKSRQATYRSHELSGKDAFRLTIRVLDRLLDDCESKRCHRQLKRTRRRVQRQAQRHRIRQKRARKHHGRTCRDCLVIRW